MTYVVNATREAILSAGELSGVGNETILQNTGLPDPGCTRLPADWQGCSTNS